MTRLNFTKTTIRNAAWITGVIVALYVIFNIFTIIILDAQLEENLDRHIVHETEHFLNTFYFDGDSLIIYNPVEFQESDLVEITENPFFLQIYSTAGEVFIRSQNLLNYSAIPLVYPAQESTEIALLNNNVDGVDLRCGYSNIFNKQHEFIGYLQLCTPKSTALKISRKIIWFNAITFPFMLILIMVISIFISKKSFAPINNIIDLANKISAKKLDERLLLNADSHDEIGRLCDTLNRLFDRLEEQFGQIVNFTDNASHQLMTPLTVINTELEFLNKQALDNEFKNSIQLLHEQTRRMIHIIKTLLILAKGCRACMDPRSVFDLQKLIENDIKPLFDHEQVDYNIEPNILLRGNKDYFAMALQNLLDNAVKYSPDTSPVKVTAHAKDEMIIIAVEDNGIGISASEKQKLFERFYRGEKAQRDGIQGFGLGLSLVFSIVTSMGGAIEIRDNIPNGSIFILSLPRLRME